MKPIHSYGLEIEISDIKDWEWGLIDDLDTRKLPLKDRLDVIVREIAEECLPAVANSVGTTILNEIAKEIEGAVELSDGPEPRAFVSVRILQDYGVVLDLKQMAVDAYPDFPGLPDVLRKVADEIDALG